MAGKGFRPAQLAQSPQVTEGVGQDGVADLRCAGDISDRDFFNVQIAAVKFDLGLKEMGARADSAIENNLEAFSREELEAAGHIAEARAEQSVGKRGSSAAEEPATERRVLHLATGHEAAAEDAVVALLYSVKESGDIGGLVAEAGVDFEYVIVSRGEGRFITAKVGIDDAAVRGRPDDTETRFGVCVVLKELARSVAGGVIEDDVIDRASQFRACQQYVADQCDRGFGFVRHGRHDSERNSGAWHGFVLDRGGGETGEHCADCSKRRAGLLKVAANIDGRQELALAVLGVKPFFKTS